MTFPTPQFFSAARIFEELKRSTIKGVIPGPVKFEWANEPPLQVVPTGVYGPLKIGWPKAATSGVASSVVGR